MDPPIDKNDLKSFSFNKEFKMNNNLKQIDN